MKYNIAITVIQKTYHTKLHISICRGILDLTDQNHKRFFNSSTLNLINQNSKDNNFKINSEISSFFTIEKLNLTEARLKLDNLVIPNNENTESLRYVKKIYELLWVYKFICLGNREFALTYNLIFVYSVDDFRSNQALEDPSMTERTYTSKFLVPIIDGALSCVHPRLRLQWCESKSASNITKLKTDNILKDGRDGALIDSVGTLNRKYDLVALEVAGKPSEEVVFYFYIRCKKSISFSLLNCLY